MLRFFRDPQTKEFLIAGTGQQHIEVVVSQAEEPLPHRGQPEGAQGSLSRNHPRHAPTCRAATRSRPAATASSATARSRWSLCRAAATSSSPMRSSAAPSPRTSSPRSKKASSKPPRAAYLAGYPGRRLQGHPLRRQSYHDVDSNELSFKTAGRIAFRKAMEQAKPTLLEPIMSVEITIPDEFAGAIMGDLNCRRGRIQGMDNKGGNTVVKADGAHGRDADLRHRPHLHDPGPRLASPWRWTTTTSCPRCSRRRSSPPPRRRPPAPPKRKKSSFLAQSLVKKAEPSRLASCFVGRNPSAIRQSALQCCYSRAKWVNPIDNAPVMRP